MAFRSLLLFVLYLCVVDPRTPTAWGLVHRPCHRQPKEHESRPSRVVTRPLPHEYLKPADLPHNYDWRLVDGTCYVSAVTNQFLPSACGSCWAHAATGALTDRLLIEAKGAYPVVQLSPQVLLDLGGEKVGTCNGGSDIAAYEFIHQYGITDVTCSPYMGVDAYYWGEISTSRMMCRACGTDGTCSFVNGTKTFVKEYGSVLGEEEMMAEIYARGPISCSVNAHAPAFENYAGGIIVDPTQYNFTTHDVAITGWGVSSDGVKYWSGRNSFGTTWGEEGWFKLERGTNCLNIEKTQCAWATLAPQNTQN